MKYLIMIQSNPAVAALFGAMSDDERTAAYQLYWDIERDLEESGELVDSKALDVESQEVVQRGADGPVARPLETDHTISGYYLIDVSGMERAREIAVRFPEAAVADGIRLARTWTQEDFDALDI